MVVVKKHSIGLAYGVLAVLPAYVQAYITSLRSKLDEYHIELAKATQGYPRRLQEDTLLRRAQEELDRAEAVLAGMEDFKGALEVAFKHHFEEWAEVFRQVRLNVGVADIRSIPELGLALDIAMDTLYRENPKFDHEKFIKYINQ